MSASVLVAYATRYGSTQEVAEAVAATLREGGLAVDVQRARDVRAVEGYRAVVLGAPLMMSHWNKDAIHFLSRHHPALIERPIAIFALGPVGSAEQPIDEKGWRECREQLDRDLAQFAWLRPFDIALFGGKVDPSKLHFPESMFARWIPASDSRDWAAIRAWASALSVKLQPTGVPASGRA